MSDTDTTISRDPKHADARLTFGNNAGTVINTLQAKLAECEAEREAMRADAERVKTIFEEECADSDKICVALGVQRTEGGRLNIPKILSAIKALKC